MYMLHRILVSATTCLQKTENLHRRKLWMICSLTPRGRGIPNFVVILATFKQYQQESFRQRDKCYNGW